MLVLVSTPLIPFLSSLNSAICSRTNVLEHLLASSCGSHFLPRQWPAQIDRRQCHLVTSASSVLMSTTKDMEIHWIPRFPMHGQHGGDVFATMLTLPSHLEQGLSLYGPSVFSGRPMMSMQMSMISLLHYVSVHGFLFLFIIDSRCHFFSFSSRKIHTAKLCSHWVNDCGSYK